MDMEKIIIRCHADYLQYEFPKRKWYDVRQYNRIALMRLAFLDTDSLECDIALEVYEDYTEEPFYHVEEEFRKRLYEAMLFQYRKKYRDAEHLILTDNGEDLSGFLYALADNRNYLSICTQHSEWYEEVVEYTEENYGLMPMFFASPKELFRYRKQMSEKKKSLFVMGNPDAPKEGNAVQKAVNKYLSSIVCNLREDSVLVDFSDRGICQEMFFKKRMQITYASIPIFLDNIVKNRYNAVVNEGITIQVKKDKKQVWRRKGNEDGRKEKYPDL